ncbi:hypothetical protein BDV19DRAFT_385371 [Aspergillus venezuelensis]
MGECPVCQPKLHAETKIPEVVTYGTKPWNIELVVCYSPGMPGWPYGFPQSDTNSCFVAMRTTQLARTKNGVDGHFNLIFCLVASENAVQLHALRDDGDIWFSPIIVLTVADGQAKDWAFFRWTIHENSTRMPGRAKAMYPGGVQHSMSSLLPLEIPIRRVGQLGSLQDRTTTETSTTSSLCGLDRSTPITGHSDDGGSQVSYHQLESDENELRQLDAKWDECHVCGSYVGKPSGEGSAGTPQKP